MLNDSDQITETTCQPIELVNDELITSTKTQQ